LAAAVVEYARERGIELAEPSLLEAIPGQGVHAVVEGRDVWVGNAALARAHGFADLEDESLARQQDEGRTVLVATIDGAPGATIVALRWSAMGSTTHPRSRRQTSGSPSAAAPTSPSRPPTSCSSVAIRAAYRAPSGSRGARSRPSGRTSSGPSSTTSR